MIIDTIAARNLIKQKVLDPDVSINKQNAFKRTGLNYSATSYGVVKQWLTKSRCGRTSTETIPSLDRPNEINTPEMINKTHDIFLNDPKVKVREIAEIVSILTVRVFNILHTHLCMRKLCAK